MKRSKFTEAQIAFILRQAEEGTAVGEVCRKAVGDETAAPARGKEWQAEEDRGRPVARQGDAAGRDPPKVLKPAGSGKWLTRRPIP